MTGEREQGGGRVTCMPKGVGLGWGEKAQAFLVVQSCVRQGSFLLNDQLSLHLYFCMSQTLSFIPPWVTRTDQRTVCYWGLGDQEHLGKPSLSWEGDVIHFLKELSQSSFSNVSKMSACELRSLPLVWCNTLRQEVPSMTYLPTVFNLV